MIKWHAQNCRHLLIKSQCFPYASCLESRWLWPALIVKWVGDTKDEENHRVLTSGEIQHPKCPQEWQNRWVFSFKRLYEVGISMNFHEFPWISFMATCKKDMLIHSLGYRWMGNLAEAYLGLLIRSSAVTVGDTQGDFKSLGRYQHQEF